MNDSVYHTILKAIRKVYIMLFSPSDKETLMEWAISDAEKSNKIIFDILSKGEPCMIARFGANEMATLVNYIGVKSHHKNIFRYITDKEPQWWWNENIMRQMGECAGFFPSTPENLSRFSKLLLNDATQLDVLGSWLSGEKYIKHLYSGIPQIQLPLLEPFHTLNPWTRWLKNKDVVVVHPFANSIRSQYARRELLFVNQEILPKFKSLRIIPAVQSIGEVNNGFKDWFEALDWMKNELDKEPYDVALIGCGAYGFHLAAHAKRTGHQGIHLGGVLQLLFGIKGKRWEKPEQCSNWNLPLDTYSNLFNDNWVYPSKDETPISANKVEKGCYW